MLTDLWSRTTSSRKWSTSFWWISTQSSRENISFIYALIRPNVVDLAKLRDAMHHDDDATNTGQRVMFPSTFNGSLRYMHQRTQDAMAYSRKFGKPELFITFTCNPKWKEIKETLLKEQHSSDKHNTTARVFTLNWTNCFFISEGLTHLWIT